MSNTLVPANGGPNFAQQGSVDWIALSRSTLSFSVEVLSRFSKAGVEMITVAMGQAIFSSFNIPPSGQKRLSDAISKLKSFSSYGQVLWFGFGIKPIVRTLCETEQGSACAAICACLSVSYDSSYASQVLKVLADSSPAPKHLTPALPQWAAMFNVCAGAINDSQFPKLVEGFSSLLGHPSRGVEIRALQEPTTATALAGAIQELAKVSNGSLQNVTFEGGADCGWLAAVAQWLLDLRVEIIDGSGAHLYSTMPVDNNAEAQVTVIQNLNKNQHQANIVSRSFAVPPGALCFRLLHETLSDEVSQPLFSKGRSNWSSILHDTFGTSVKLLFSDDMAQIVAIFFSHALVTKGQYTPLGTVSPWGNCHGWEYEVARFFEFSARRLPETSNMLQAVNQHPRRFKQPLFPESFQISFPTTLRPYCACIDCKIGTSILRS